MTDVTALGVAVSQHSGVYVQTNDNEIHYEA